VKALEDRNGEGQSHLGFMVRIDPCHTEMIFASYFAGCAARVVQLAFSTVVQHFGVRVQFQVLGFGTGLIVRLVRGRTEVYRIHIFI